MKTNDYILIPLTQNGQIPNNPRLPLLIYRQAFTPTEDASKQLQDALDRHHWGGSWKNGVNDYHHYHSTSHEVLAVYSGKATLMLGGPGGTEVEVSNGDVVIIPAGVGHCSTYSSDDFKVVGAYPKGQEDYDMCTEKNDPEEKKKNIQKVPLPVADPIAGKDGPLMKEWR